MAKERIALFGGTFDPIHLGHTGVAARAVEHIGAQKVVFIPAKRSPLKGFLPVASDEDRLRMIALAIAGSASFEVSDCELRKAAPSYSLETVRQFQTDYGGESSLFWLIGADSVDDLTHWYRITDLIDTCVVSTMYRAGCEPPDFTRFEPIWGRERVEKLRKNVVETPLIDISSTEIRSRLAAGDDADDMLHPAVADYIRERGLYRSKAAL
ncbi:MAG: nicotinate (nicotinamide) nucleotide adenylyltransferase [Phycisphaerales bacterium]|nr:MAG: nicotinate (nicotinamide) nucleotide adenylyltransferase [Phycisphaerales bacterium]